MKYTLFYKGYKPLAKLNQFDNMNYYNINVHKFELSYSYRYWEIILLNNLTEIAPLALQRDSFPVKEK